MEEILIDEKVLREIPGFEKYYITSDGEVFSAKSGRWLSIREAGSVIKYKTVALNAGKNGKKKTYQQLVHKLVALAWVPLPEGYKLEDVLNNNLNRELVVIHKNRDNNDNRASNLEWIDTMDMRKRTIYTKNYGNKNATYKVNLNHDPYKRYIYYYEGERLKLRELAAKLGCSKSCITEAFRKNLGLVKRGKLTREEI